LFLSLEKPAATFSISHVTRVKTSASWGVAEQEAIGGTRFLGGSDSSTTPSATTFGKTPNP